MQWSNKLGWDSTSFPVILFNSIIVLSPCEGSKQGGSKFNWEKKNTHPHIYCVKDMSDCDRFWPQLSPDWQNRMAWSIFGWGYLSQNVLSQTYWYCLGRGPKNEPFVQIYYLFVMGLSWKFEHRLKCENDNENTFF